MQIGDVLDGRYELSALAASGGMGQVFRAIDRRSGNIVAVKALLEGSPSARARFEREARVLSELHHPAIVGYIAHGHTAPHEPYLVMEWLEGMDLGHYRKRAKLRLDEAVGLVTRVAEALGAAHARGIVHRDLKPGNLLLVHGRPDQVKVLDFGIAQLADLTRVTATGTSVGTPGYMAPEQIRSGEIIDARADVFALGCVLFECVTGQSAFSGTHIMALLTKILFEEPRRMSELHPGVPASLDALVASMLAKDPTLRPRDGAAVAAALGAITTESTFATGGEPLPPTQPVLPTPPTSWWPPSSRSAGALTRGERRLLCLVLVDRGVPDELAPTLSDNAGPERTTHAEMRRIVEGNGGTLVLLADGSAVGTIVSATPSAMDQAALAARCALSLSALLPERPVVLSTEWAEVTGRLPVGSVADCAAKLLAGRPSAAGNAPAIAIDELIAGLLDAHFEVERDAAGLYFLRGERDAMPAGRTLLGRPTACVGRDREIAALESAFSAAVEDRVAQTFLVTAPAGMGKSRLAYEVVRRIRQREVEVEVWTGRVDSLRAGSAFGLLGHALRGALSLPEGETLEARQQQLRAQVTEHVAATEQKRVTEFLGEFLGTPFSDEHSAPLRAARQDARLMGDQMRQAFIDFLRATVTRRPVLLVLEDLHWGDLPTVRLIDAALRELHDQPWMVLALARPEVHDRFPKLWIARGIQEIRLKELTRRASEQLVRQALGDGIEPGMVERVVAQAGGHAFYLEELIRAVADGKDGALPQTVLAMVQSRLEGLEPDARRVLRAASVFGEVCWSGGVTALLGGSRRAIRAPDELAALVEREILVRQRETRFPGEAQFAFRHALLREGAYAMLTEENLALGHRLAGEWLERHGEHDALLLAEHFELGGVVAKAGEYYLRAAEHAHRAGDTATAIARAQRGLDGGVSGAMRIELLGMLCDAHSWRTHIASAVAPHAEELLRIARPGSIPWARGAFVRIGASLQAGSMDEFVATLRAILSIDASSEGASELGPALGAATVTLDYLGEIAEGDIVLERLTMISAASEERAPLATLWRNGIGASRGAYAWDDPYGALQCARAGASMAREMNYQRYQAAARPLEGMNLWCLGAFEEAAEALQETAISDEELGMGSSVRRFSLAWLLADRVAIAEARAPAEELVASGQALHLPLDEGRGRWVLAEVLRRKGELDAAEREIQAGLAILATVSPLDNAGARATLAAIRLDQGRLQEARSAAEEALSKYEAMGSCGMFRAGYLRLVHAECLRAAGDSDAARAAIAKARDRVQRIAAKIDDPEYRRSFLENVPENARTFALASAWLGEASVSGPLGLPDQPTPAPRVSGLVPGGSKA